MVTIFMNFLGKEAHYDDHCHDSAGLMKYYIQKGLFWQKNIFKFFFYGTVPGSYYWVCEGSHNVVDGIGGCDILSFMCCG